MPENWVPKIKQLLSAKPNDNSFIIFIGRSDFEYVQFSLENYGLLLFWPVLINNLNKNIDEANKVSIELIKKGYTKLDFETNNREEIEKLRYKEFVSDSTGIYANVGNDPEKIAGLTADLFITIYNFKEIDKIHINLEL